MLCKTHLQWQHIRSFISMKQYAFFALILVSMVIFAMAFVKKGPEYPDKHLEIVLRNIGHEVLLHSKDSGSRVMPVRKVNENTFRISFEKSFGFIPDTLMNLVHQQLAKTDHSGDYTVSVNECAHNQTIFAYEVTKAGDDLRPCRGREQKHGCYVIEISFPEKKSFNTGWLLFALIPLAVAGLYFIRRRAKPTESKEPVEDNIDDSSADKAEHDKADTRKLGNFTFIESKGILTLNGETIELSDKETKALTLLLSNQNEVVGRDLLMQEIWEKDGVFVITRNVDVLISKLRKRLSADPAVKILNVHGKGYKMIA
jgi:hypothetical protein